MFTAFIIRENPKVIYRVASSMVSERANVSLGLEGTGLLTTLGGAVPSQSNFYGEDWQYPSMGTAQMKSDSLVLRIEPAPDRGVQFSSSAEGQEEAVIYAPLSASYSRKSGIRNATIEFVLDSILTPQSLGVSDWNPPPNWINQYVAFLEALMTPIPVLGRKPWIAIKHGSVVHGAGRFGFQLEAVDYNDEWFNSKGVARMSIRVRLREYLVV